MNKDEIIFGSICRASRAWLGWSQTEFGKKINKSTSSISIIEQGKNCSNLEMYVNILSIFEKAGIKVNKTKGKITLTITLNSEEITMTTFTTEDRQNSSPPHIVDGGASHQTLGEFIAHKKMVNELIEEIDVQKKVIQSLSETGQRLYDENRHLKESFRSISNQLTNMMELWEFKR